MPYLSDQLKSLGVQIGARNLPAPKKSLIVPIEEVVEGQFVDTPYGQAFVVETFYPPEHQQGRFGLQLSAPLAVISAWAREPRLHSIDPHALIFLDTETSGLAGGTGTYAFLIGVGRLIEDGFHLKQYFMRDPIEEPAQLAALNGFLSDFEGIVTFNGKSFDIPILNARFITNGELPPFKTSAHLDLLPLARRLWRDRLPERNLRELEINILEMVRSQEEVPGWLVPQIYFDYLKSGDARPLRGVFYHNAMDVVSLAALLNHMSLHLHNPTQGTLKHGIDLIALGKLYEDLDDYNSAAQLYQQGLESKIPESSRHEALYRWSLMEKRRGDWTRATDLWRMAVDYDEIYAYIELAKYYEHRVRDDNEARSWTQKALDLVEIPHQPGYEGRQLYPELIHRMTRLVRKLKL